MGKGPGSSSRNIHNIFELFCRTKASAQEEDGNFRLNTRLLEHHPDTSPPTNQKKVTHPAALIPNLAYKTFSPKTIREFRVFEHKPPILLAWPRNKPSSAQKKKERKKRKRTKNTKVFFALLTFALIVQK